jgi:hypothetical protein
MSRAFCIPGVFFLFAAFVLLFIVSVSLPYLTAMDITRVHTNGGSAISGQATMTQLRVSFSSLDVFPISTQCGVDHVALVGHLVCGSPKATRCFILTHITGLTVTKCRTETPFVTMLVSNSHNASLACSLHCLCRIQATVTRSLSKTLKTIASISLPHGPVVWLFIPSVRRLHLKLLLLNIDHVIFEFN